MNAASRSAELAIVGARVRTLDPAQPFATAVAIRDGVLIGVGSDADVRERCDARTEVVDGTGMAIVPGLTDAHQHPLHGAEDTTGADLAGRHTLPEVQAALRAERDRVGADGWVLGHSLEYAAFGDEPIAAAAIDEAVGGAPALVTFFDFHTALASSSALAVAGVGGAREFGATSEIVCDPAGAPTGELRERPAIDLVRDAQPELTEDERLALYAAAFARMNAVGLTGVHGMDGTAVTLDRLRALEESGRLTVRVIAPFTIEPDLDPAAYPALIALRDEAGRRWRAGVAKFFIDGVVETGTAWLEEPDAFGRGLEPFWPDEASYAAAVARFAGAGFACATHAIGDRAVRAALDAYRAAPPAPGRRHRIEHLETLPDATLARVAAEGVTASMQAIHLQWADPDGADPWSQALGPERTARAFRIGDLHASGAVLALGSDWPVAGFDPRLGMAWARLRRAPGSDESATIGRSQRLGAMAALEGYTTAAARAVCEHDRSGRVAVGYRADLTALAADPVEVGADDLPDVDVALTVVDGAVVYRRA